MDTYKLSFTADKIDELLTKVDELEEPVQGDPGKSAYEVALDNGFKGTEAEWLASLHGKDGATGPQGPAGPAGSTSSIEITPTTPTTATMYYLLYASGKSGDQVARANDDLYYYDLGAASYLNVGSNNNVGGLTLHYSNGYYTNIYTDKLGGNRNIVLPDKNGTLATLDDITSAEYRVITLTGPTQSLSLTSNVEYRCVDAVTALTVSAFDAETSDQAETWGIQFIAGESIAVDLPDTVVWNYGAAPVFTPGNEYHLMFAPMLSGKVLGVWNEVEA